MYLLTYIEKKLSASARLAIWTIRFNDANLFKQGVAPTGRNTTGPPCSVGRPTSHAPGRRRADRPRTRRLTKRHRASADNYSIRTVTIRRQATDDDRRQPAKQYWPIKPTNNVTNFYQLTSHSTTSCPTTWRSYCDHRLLWHLFTLCIVIGLKLPGRKPVAKLIGRSSSKKKVVKSHDSTIPKTIDVLY